MFHRLPSFNNIWSELIEQLDKIPGDDEEEHDVVIELED